AMIRLATTDPDFAIAFATLLDQTRETTESVDRSVAAIIAEVRVQGDAALLRYTERFDRWTPTADRLRIAAAEIDIAIAEISSDLLAALDLAAERIEAFHRLQVPSDLRTTDSA